ncbi:CARDB domain-containing protein [Natronobacterium lacisalsi]|uniref:CARDB domain-containing protein n=1 Tax=Natronobacterium lacisalsi TaxID=229731 RepID=UPI0002632258|nr:CARDB domain-containing protein [Halobiforma lacisalsi]
MNYRVVFAVALLVASLPAGIGGVVLGTGSASPGASVGATDRTQQLEHVGPDPDPDPDSSTPSVSGSSDVLSYTTELRQIPKKPTYEAEIRFSVPDSVSEVEVDLDLEGTAEATVRSADGFESTADGVYRWTGETAAPSLLVTLPANRTGHDDRQSPTVSERDDGYSFVDAGDWAIVPVPQLRVYAQGSEPVGLESSATVDGSGATGGDVAVFGEVTEYERLVEGERLRLVVPAAADLQEAPDDVLETLAAGSQRLAVGERPDETFVVAAPTGVDWGSRGLQYGDADAWVRADAPLDEPDNVWLHEYVHVRQAYAGSPDATATDATWLVEAQAEYHAAQVALGTGLIGFEEFERFLERGERSPYADGILAEPGSWDDPHTDYVQGPLVYGEIDRRLRVVTDGDRTLVDVFRTLNARAANDRIAAADFYAALEEAGDASVREAAERYAETKALPSMWSRGEHEAAFDQPVPAIDYGHADPPLAVDGEPWERWETDEGRLAAVPAGTTVAVPVEVANVGDRAGSYDATLQVDGVPVDRAQGSLETGERATERLSWTPPEPGTYELRVGSETTTVIVRAPSSVAVADLDLEPREIDPGESAAVTATVEPADDRPAAAFVAVRTHEGVVAEAPVAVRAGETATITREVRFDEEGRHEVAVGDRVVTVTVGSLPLAELEEVPGFGVGVSLAALAAVLAGLVAFRRQ